MKKRMVLPLLTVMLILSACGAASQTETQTEVAEKEPEAVTEVKEEEPSAEDPVKQEDEAISKEDYENKIDELTANGEYEDAYALINEGNEALGGNALDDKLAGIPDGIIQGVKSEEISTLDGYLFILYVENRGDGYYLINDPEMTYRDGVSHLELSDMAVSETEDGNKQYTFKLNSNIEYTLQYPQKYNSGLNWFYSYQLIGFYDYYTGKRMYDTDTVLSMNEDQADGDGSNDISWNGKDIRVNISYDAEGGKDQKKTVEATEEGMVAESHSPSTVYTYTVTCPKDYDGFCIYVHKASAVPEDGEKRIAENDTDANGKILDQKDQKHAIYLFKDENEFGNVPTADVTYVMRLDDFVNP